MKPDANIVLAAMALDSIRGCQAAQRLLQRIREGTAHPDESLEAMREAFATGSDAHVSGFAREMQKALERAA